MEGDRGRRYGGEHQAIRKAMLPHAVGSLCARCGLVIGQGEPVDLDHADDGSGYLGWSHARCNRAAGGRRSQTLGARRLMGVLGLPRVVVAAEVSWLRTHTSIGAAGWAEDEGVWRVELVDYVEGTDVVDRVSDLGREANVGGLVVDPVSPAAPLADALGRRRGVRVTSPGLRDVATATGEFVDALRRGEVRAADQPVLREAVRRVEVRQTALGIAFDRRSDVDASPLVAVSLALWGARRLAPVKDRRILVGDGAGIVVGDEDAVEPSAG